MGTRLEVLSDLVVRPAVMRPGPEEDLVERFLAAPRIDSPPGCCTTLFKEPRLRSGRPDIVAVIWHLPTASRWQTARESLIDADLRLVQLLLFNGPTPETRLRELFRRPPFKSLERLEAAALIKRQRGIWEPRSLSRTFAVRRIVAYEAKVSAWLAGVSQAALNRWFASESYVLIPRMPRHGALLETARGAGVGIWLDDRPGPALKAKRAHGKQPLSYASWLFNEWVWREARAHGMLKPCST